MEEVASGDRDPHPKSKANFFSAATFFYTIPTFLQDHKNEFDEKDLYEIVPDFKSNNLGNKLERLWNQELMQALRNKRSPSLMTVLIKAFGVEFMLWGFILVLIECIIKPLQSLTLGWMISYYSNDQGLITRTDAYLYGLGIILLSLFNVIFLHPFMANSVLLGLKIKVACCSLLYRKSLRLSNAAFEVTNVGRILSLFSTDVVNFLRCSLMIQYVWVGPIQCIIITYLLYQEFGLSAIFGIFMLLLFIPLYMLLGKLSSKHRLKAATRTDNRVRFMNEIIMGIQVIKVYAWEKAVQKLVNLYRKSELKHIRISSYIKGTYLTFDILVVEVLLYATVVAYVIFGNNIDAQKFFTLTIFYSSLRLTMATFFPQGIGVIAEVRVSIQRMNEFLLCCEVESTCLQSSDSNNNKAFEICNASAAWKKSMEILSDINLNVTRGSLVAVVGTVGSGKSSLLNIMLKELPLTKGDIKVRGSISYASQEPWLFSSSIRQNILFGEELDLPRYNDVLRICSLEEDFKLLPYSDKTLIGRRGASLSGGQRARINLARAIYKQADIYLLDDPLSALDARIGKQVFYECIKDFLKEKTVILVTHQMQYLNHVDRIIVLDNGSVRAEGSFDSLQNSLDFQKFFGGAIDEMKSVRKLNADTEMIKVKVFDGKQQPCKEEKTDGTVSFFVYKSYIIAGANCIMVILMGALFLCTQLSISGSAYFMTYWVNMKQKSLSMGFKVSEENYIYVYSLIILSSIVFSLSGSLFFLKVCMKSSEKLHSSMFNSVISATMRFFNTNSSGRILNRFSNDMGIVDMLLPIVAVNTTQILLGSIASLILICAVNYWLFLPAVIVGVVFYFLKNYCLQTTRNIKRLEGVTRSPVFEHLTSSLQGLHTIRAFRAQNILAVEFDQHQDLNSCTHHLFVTTSQAFGYVLDWIGVMYMSVVILSFLVMGNETYGGNVGLAITQCLATLSSLQWGIRQSAELENYMTSAERILEYNSIEHETQSKYRAPKNWPQVGEIRFANVYFKYFPEDPPVLKNISFTIRPLEKVGIVGRTGAGKSSLISALFLLSDLEGAIYIDNIDITNLNLQDLRSKISIIPQDPVIFSGTFRKNLDPFDEFNDEDLWNVLEEIKLKDAVCQLPQGLQSNLFEGGSNLSVGQRQLICLARAILRNNKILVLDEATANVDPETDELIQKTIRSKFERCTVLTIAHRLHTVVDSDKIMVVNEGKIVEFDRPEVLLQNRNGYFYELMQEGGQTRNKIKNGF